MMRRYAPTAARRAVTPDSCQALSGNRRRLQTTSNASTSVLSGKVDDALWSEFAAAELASAENGGASGSGGSRSSTRYVPGNISAEGSSKSSSSVSAARGPAPAINADTAIDALWGEFANAEKGSALECESGRSGSSTKPRTPGRLSAEVATSAQAPENQKQNPSYRALPTRKRKAKEESAANWHGCKQPAPPTLAPEVRRRRVACSSASQDMPASPSGRRKRVCSSESPDRAVKNRQAAAKGAVRKMRKLQSQAPQPNVCGNVNLVQWRVRNLTYEYNSMLADLSLTNADRVRNYTVHALETCNREMRELQQGLQSMGRVGPGPSVEESRSKHCEAHKHLREIRDRIQTLPPGPDLIEANVELKKAHQAAVAAGKDYQRVQCLAQDGHQAEQMSNTLQEKRSYQAELKQKAAELTEAVRRLENARAPLTQEFASASQVKEELPPLVVHVCPLPVLKKAVREKTEDLRFGCLADMVRTEWALRVALGEQQLEQQPEQNRAYGMLSPSSLFDAFDFAPGSADGIILALEEHLVTEAADGPVKSASAADTAPPRTRYYLARAQSISTMREQVTKLPPIPHSLELLRASLDLVPDMWLHKTVLQACHQAFLPHSCQVPRGLHGQLRPYQTHGFEWLVCNAENGFGCILADDMGLGKTLQSIALLLHLHSIGRIGCQRRACCSSTDGSKSLPALVVAPYSVLRTWELELKRWAPCLECYVYHGSNRRLPCLLQSQAELNEGSGGPDAADVFLTTYQTLQKDSHKISGLDPASASAPFQRFGCIILDESQNIKNAGSQTSKAVKQVAYANGGSCFRLALSGTPVENRLLELHSLFEYLNFGLLGTKDEFTNNFVKPVEKTSSIPKGLSKHVSEKYCKEEAIRKLKVAIGPFMLRRCKTDATIAPELPDKVELLHVVQLGSAQRQLYSAVANEVLQTCTDESHNPVHHENDAEVIVLDDDSEPAQPQRRVTQVLAMLHGLQQVCNHPAALPADRWPTKFQDQRESREFCAANHLASGKSARLLQLLEEILEPPRDKVLIFTQYRATLDFLATLVDRSFPDVRTQRFHGGLSRAERDAATTAFSQDPSSAVMVLTLQAGGVGLTLTAASHVIHFDRCWNPAKEMQATDRAHRLGQRRTVVVHRLLTAETFEERLAKVVEQKVSLASSVIAVNAAQVLTNYSDRQLRQLFLLGGGAGTAMQGR